MDTIDRQILKAIFTEKDSIYRAEKDSIKDSSYATVWRHIQNLENDKLITFVQAYRKDGQIDKRKKKGKPTLTPKGVATLLIDGDLKKDEVLSVGKELFLTYFGQEIFLTIQPLFAEIFTDALMGIKPKVNLKYFDEDYFVEVFVTSLVKALVENLSKSNLKIDEKDQKKVLTALGKIMREDNGAKECFELGLEYGKVVRRIKDKEE